MAHLHPRPVQLALAVCLLAITTSWSAGANGAFPDEFSVFFPAAAPHRILVGANFGLVVSEDDGATWRYACEPWITQGSDVALSPYNVGFYQVTADAAVLAKSIHLTRSGDDACTWPQSGGSIDDHSVSDMFADPNDATFVVALTVDSSGNDSIVASHDGGKTFDSPAIYGPTSDVLTGVEIAKSNSSVLYSTSVASVGSNPLLHVSQDRGANWTATTIPEPAGTEPLIMAIDPQDPTVVYLRVVGAQTDSIVIARGSGASFETALGITGRFVAFVRGSDGTLYAATAAAELYVRAPTATAFKQLPGPHFRCLGQRPGSSRLYACGDFQIDGFSLGYSDDGGKTFTRMMNFSDILGPLTCPSVSTNCQAHWDRIQQVLGIGDRGPQPGGDSGTSPPPAKARSSCSTGGAGMAGLIWIACLLLAQRRTRWLRNRS